MSIATDSVSTDNVSTFRSLSFNRDSRTTLRIRESGNSTTTWIPDKSGGEKMSSEKYLKPIQVTENDTADANGVRTSYLYDISSYITQGNTCMGIVAALASRSRQSELDLPPLGRVIDAGALDRLIEQQIVGDQQNPVSVTFPYEIYLITVSGNGTALIRT